jgi:nucleotide-binding universal stress UspA family protein
MFNKILVCLDGSPMAEKVLPYVVDQALHHNAEMVLFRVVSEPSLISLALPGMPGVPVETAGMERQIKGEEKQVESYLAALAERIQTENKENSLNVSYDSTLGEAGESIVEYADDHEVELIALATHGRSGPSRVVLGSVADYVIRNTRLPILLIRPLVEKSK